MKMFRLATVVAALGVGFLSAGCGGSDSGSGTELSETRAVSTAPVERSGLILTLSAPKGVYKRGETVPLTMTARNAGAEPVSVSFIQRRADRCIEDAGGATVQYFPPVSAGGSLQLEEFAPGETKQYELSTPLIRDGRLSNTQGTTQPPLPPGIYRLKAWLGGIVFQSNPPTPIATAPEPLTIRVVE